jgi:hypothetical protein
MTEHNTESTVRISDEQRQERLRQEQETFTQHKSHENRWFTLRLVMGYTSVVLLLSIIGVCLYVFLNYAALPTAIVTSASVAFFADVVGLVIAVWQIVFNPDFLTKLVPVTRVAPVTAVPQDTLDESAGHEAEETTILSATYGKGEKTKDVTGIVKSIVAAAATGHVRFTVVNENLGGDPLENVVKELKVTYSYAGETRTKTVPEYEELALP